MESKGVVPWDSSIGQKREEEIVCTIRRKIEVTVSGRGSMTC